MQRETTGLPTDEAPSRNRDPLRVHEATCRFGALTAVDQVSFELAPGEICGLVGPNGSGKSTLLNLISGVQSMTAGQITLGERDITSWGAHDVARARVARTFQITRLMTNATARENVLSGMYGESPDRHLHAALVPVSGKHRAKREELRARADAALERLNISEYADRAVDELSYGIQRRVEMARALVSSPSLLLLDEPAAGVVEKEVKKLGEIIRQEAERGCAILLVEHHLRFVLDVAPRLIVMNFGRKIFDGTSEEAVKDPAVQEAYVGT